MTETQKTELPKAYIASDVEKKWYDFWEKEGFFHADPHSKKPPYCIMIPPPNVTGVLHMGHALVNTLQDILIRWKRMSGYDALWMPGTDHAGIATQTVVERHLMKTQGKGRRHFTRDAFLAEVWKWKEQSEKQILSQLKRMGASCDWSRTRFTMDEGNNHSVKVMFKKLFDEGLVYRGDYLVNWDPITQTALADDEVEYEERSSFLWHFTYPIANDSSKIEIATTRPETMLGDTAIAVSPKDPRFLHLIGKVAIHPLTKRELIIIADDHVDPLFGTGAVKITPAHDHDDYLMALRHNLPMINIMTHDGKINENGGQFANLTMEQARDAVTKAMLELGHFVKQVPHTNRVGVSYRSKATIEPHLSKQWFVKMSSFKDTLKSIVATGQTKLLPTHWDSTYFHWIDNLRDWCISRQLWWGHRIPIWYNTQAKDTILCYSGDGLPPEVQENPDHWVQDPDVLDTWFSSALWPFATLGWPHKTLELNKYYPNSTLITGHDILFFWVARMIMMGYYAMGKTPFADTFLHGLIYGKSYWRQDTTNGIQYVPDQDRKDYDLGKPIPKEVQSRWEKMSKSKGNIIDPLEIIAEYGADAMRMALASSATHARQIDLDRRKFEEFKNFANKIWNGARFVFLNLQANDSLPGLSPEALAKGIDHSLLTLEDNWILSRLNTAVSEVNKHLTSYAFDQAAIESYEFFWNEFCAYYVEIIKPILFGKLGTPASRENKQKLLVIVLLQSIRLLHPMAPYITEELFQLLKSQFPNISHLPSCDTLTQEAITALNARACIIAPYPLPQNLPPSDSTQKFEFLTRLVYTIRNIRGEMKIPPSSATDIYITAPSIDPLFTLTKEHQYILTSLTKINTLTFQHHTPNIPHSSTATVESLNILIPLPKELMDQEKVRLTKEEDRLTINIQKTEKQLTNEQFLEKAPPDLIEKLNNQLSQLKKELQNTQSQLDTLK